ncbi:hypothetical protein ACRRTK_019009 [Alexandromys fortis]
MKMQQHPENDGNDGDTSDSSKSNKTLSYKSKCLKMKLKISLFSPIILQIDGWVGGCILFCNCFFMLIDGVN